MEEISALFGEGIVLGCVLGRCRIGVRCGRDRIGDTRLYSRLLGCQSEPAGLQTGCQNLLNSEAVTRCDIHTGILAGGLLQGLGKPLGP